MKPLERPVAEHGAGSVALAAILAGGRSRRMGTDKAALTLGGVPLVERVWSTVSRVADRVVAVGGDAPLERLGVPTVPDRYPGAGSLGGLATALHHARGLLGPDAWVLCVACDMPLLEPRLLRYLHAVGEAADAVVPRVEAGYEPLCALYRVRCWAAFDAQIAAGKLRIWSALENLRVREVPESELRGVDPDLRSFLNVNRPADLERARRMLSGAA